jgi:hypothetical protein
MGIRLDADWMQQLDERIIEALHEDRWLSPSVLASRAAISASERRIRERFLVLAHAHSVAPLGGCDGVISDHYVLTRKGFEYLRGELDARHHRPPPKVRRDRGGGHPATVYL